MSEIHIHIHIDTQGGKAAAEVDSGEQVRISKYDLERLLKYDQQIIDGDLTLTRKAYWKPYTYVYKGDDGKEHKSEYSLCSRCGHEEYDVPRKCPDYCENCGSIMIATPPKEITAEGGNAAAEGGNAAAEGGKSCNNANDAAQIIQTAAEGGGWALLRNRKDESTAEGGNTAAEGGNTAEGGEEV